MGFVILCLMIGIPTAAFWVVLIGLLWTLWSVSSPGSSSNIKRKGPVT